MTRQKIFRIIVQISRFGIAGLFLFTAGAKLWTVKDFAAGVTDLLISSGVNQFRWTWPVTITVIAVEIVTAICLLVRPTVRAGALLAAALLIGFSGFALYYVYVLQGEPLECGCFGKIIGSQLGLTTALRNLALLVPTFLIFFGFRRSVRPSVTTREAVGVTEDVFG